MTFDLFMCVIVVGDIKHAPRLDLDTKKRNNFASSQNIFSLLIVERIRTKMNIWTINCNNCLYSEKKNGEILNLDRF